MPDPSAFRDLTTDPLLRTGGDAGAVASVIAEIEAALRVRVTIHDHAGEIAAADGTRMLSDERRNHRHPLCMAARRGAGGLRCLAHCMRACGERAAGASTAFAHRCWAGLEEVVVPVWADGRHRATVFLGPWRQASAEDCGRAVVLGRLLADALLAATARAALAPGGDDRRTAVLRAVVAGDSLDALARRLGLSSSRTSRVVRSLCGRPWRRLLVEERLRQARVLLSTSGLPCARIAERLGYATPGHFQRCFRASEGISPGAWRRRARA